MTKMTRTNYWNPGVKYAGKTSAQSFMMSAKAKKVGAGVYGAASSCSCSSGCSACSSSCGSCTSCSTSCS